MNVIQWLNDPKFLEEAKQLLGDTAVQIQELGARIAALESDRRHASDQYGKLFALVSALEGNKKPE